MYSSLMTAITLTLVSAHLAYIARNLKSIASFKTCIVENNSVQSEQLQFYAEAVANSKYRT